jgi:hypothetical protein
VLVDVEFELWQEFGNRGWPARFLFDQNGCLFEYHYGEGDYVDTELAIQELLGVERAPLDPVRPEDAVNAVLAPQSEDVPGAYSGPYEAGAVWAVLDGNGSVTINGADPPLRVDHPGAYELISNAHSTAGTLALQVGDGVRCHAVCFTPGLAE